MSVHCEIIEVAHIQDGRKKPASVQHVQKKSA